MPGTPLATLARKLAAACAAGGVPPAEPVLDALRAAIARPGLLSPAQRAGSDARYARHLLHADAAGRFTALALVWRPGQFSPVHWHHGWCAYAVVEGTLEETGYAWDAARETARATARRPRRQGDACFAAAGPERIHRLGNGGAREAVSLHVYGVAAADIATGVNRIVDELALA